MSQIHRLLAVMLLCVFAPAAYCEQLKDPRFGFSLTLPSGFQSDPEMVARSPNFIHAFRLPGGPGVDTFLIIERMNGTLSRERLKPSDMPADFKGRLLPAQWTGLTIDVIELPELFEGHQIINYNAQVPLRGEAIQLRVIGPHQDQARLRAIMDQVLLNLTGESSWRAPAAPRTPVTPAPTRKLSPVGIGDVIGFLIAVAAVALGIKGFKPEGLPLTTATRITGRPARIIGAVCIGFGLLLGLLTAAIIVLSQLVTLGIIPPVKDWFR